MYLEHAAQTREAEGEYSGLLSLSLSLATDSPNSPRLISILARLDSLSLDTFTYYLFLVVIPAAVVCSFNHTAVQAAKVQSSGLLPN